jgi:hypothetical protein
MFLRLAALTLGVAAAVAVWRLARRAFGAGGVATGGAPRVSAGLLGVALAAALLAPLAILTIDVHRGESVATFLFPPLLWLALFGVIALAGLHREGVRRPRAEAGWAALAAVVLVAAGYVQLSRYGQRTWISRARKDMEGIAEMYDLLGRIAADHDLKEPIIASNSMHEALNWIVPAVCLYERSGVLLKTKPALLSILPRDEAGALHDLELSDFVLLGRPNPEVGPFEASMERLAPKLTAYCEREMHCLWRGDVFGRDLHLYVRPGLKCEGYSDKWVTADGVTLKAPGWALRGCKRVELRGKTPFGLLKKEPAPAATLAVGGKAPRPLKAALTHKGDDYCITLELPDRPPPEGAKVEMRLTFDTYFEPKEHGWVGDPRHLVILKPESTRLVH